MGMNLVVLQGRAAVKPIAKQGKSAPFVKWQICVERPFSNEKKVDYITCIAFGKLGRNVYNNLGKGALHSVQGTLRESRWINAEGQRKRNLVVFVDKITIHQWLNKGKSITQLMEEFPNRHIPKEVMDAMWKGMDFDNEYEENTGGFGSKAIDEILKAEEEVTRDDEDIPR